MAERYNTPTEGTLDWHIPLNENFTKLDRDVEIRDVDSNLGAYEPNAGSKFLATDTGVVYIGDGDQWNRLGSVSSTSDTDSGDSEVGGQMADGSVVARPGDVHSVIDSVSTGGSFGDQVFRKVRLVSGEVYRPSETITVENGVVLDCNGAKIIPDGNHNVIELMRNSRVISPLIETQSVSGWDSVALVISGKDSGKVAVANPAWVENAFLFGAKGEGTGLQFRGGDSPCSMMMATGFIQNFDIGLDFYAAGDDISGTGDWSNGNMFKGAIQSSDVCIRMKSEGAAVSGNSIYAQIQPNDPTTEWIWKIHDDPRSGDRIDPYYKYRSNSAYIYVWDEGNVTNEYERSGDRAPPLFYFGQGLVERNCVYDLTASMSNEFIVNNSDLADRNGLFHGTGGQFLGTTTRNAEPTYEPNPDRKMWHPESKN